MNELSWQSRGLSGHVQSSQGRWLASLVEQHGSHTQFKHPTKPGRDTTVRGVRGMPGDDVIIDKRKK